LSLLLVATILFVGPLATVQQTASSTTALTDEEEDVLETQDTATENLTEEDRDVNGIEFTPRWGDISTLEPDSIDVLFADCLEDEFAVSSQFVFETSDVIASQSFPVAFEDDDDETAMSWLAVVENTHGTEDKAASIGVICASENGGDDDDNDGNIDVSTKTTIKNIIKNFIRVENNEIVNLNNIINIRQQIIQNAMQILSITGNNNTVSQVINQAATQIANVNATTPTEIQQIIDQNAQQQGVISGTGNQTSLSQMIDQEAAQQANVTEEEEGGATDIDQAIDQGAEQAANVTEEEEGGATDIDQAIDQGAEQAANVTEEEEGGATDIDQAIDQGAEQAANVTNGGGADTSIIDQLIQERAQQQAQVDEQQQQQPGEGGATDIDQAIGQNASQQAQVNDGGEVLGNSTGD
jgi:creatinine amidohydrolase/Fe(II)-dependent formamide hydrolase-like protein